jgi:hypothetical protein
MGDLITGLAGAALFIAVAVTITYAVIVLQRRVAARDQCRRETAAASARSQWETATIAHIDGTLNVILRCRTGSFVNDLNQITVATIRADSPTWTIDLINAQADAEERLSVLRAGEQQGRPR